MKKLILFGSLIILSGIWVYYLSSSPQTTSSRDDLASSALSPNTPSTKENKDEQDTNIGRTHPQDPLWDYELRIAAQTRQSLAWQKLNQYEITEKDLVFQTKDIGSLLETTNAVTQTLTACLAKDLCGIKESPNHPYFRPEETPAHELLIRTLLTQQEMLKQDLISIEEIDSQALQSLLQFENLELQNIALHLLSQKELDPQQLESIFAEESLKTTEAKATAFVELSSQSQKGTEARSIFIQALQNSFEKDAPISVISTLKELDKIKLTPQEFESLLPKLCHIKRENSQNWSRIKYYITGYIEQSGVRASDKFCD